MHSVMSGHPNLNFYFIWSTSSFPYIFLHHNGNVKRELLRESFRIWIHPCIHNHPICFQKRNRHCTQNVTYISLADLFITLILCAYLYHGIGTHNILDTFWPLAYFLFYYFLRLNGTTDPSGQWTHIAPWVISAHLLLCVFQYFSWIPNHNSLFTIGSTFGNPDMLSTYLASLLPCCYLTPKKKTYRLGLLALTLLLFVLLQARTALIASILTIVFYAAAQFKLPLKTLLACSLFLGILIVLLALWHPESLLGRFYIWMVCCHMLAKIPLDGEHALLKGIIRKNNPCSPWHTPN